jgi:hypothetical protein
MRMDHGWIATYGLSRNERQISFATEGGSARRCRTSRSKSTISALLDAEEPAARDTARPTSPGRSALLCPRSVRQTGQHSLASLTPSFRCRSVARCSGTLPPLSCRTSPLRGVGRYLCFRQSPTPKAGRDGETANLPLEGEMPGRTEGSVKIAKVRGCPSPLRSRLRTGRWAFSKAAVQFFQVPSMASGMLPARRRRYRPRGMAG